MNKRRRISSAAVVVNRSSGDSLETGTSRSKEGQIKRSIYKRHKQQQVVNEPYGPEQSQFESDEEGEVNRSGNVPLWWYDDMKHVGYTIEGKRLAKTLDTSELTKLLNEADDSENAWRVLQDVRNQTTYTLTAADIDIINRIRQHAFPVSSFDPYGDDSIVEFDNPDARIHPECGQHPPKSRFIPSLHENKKINKLVRMIRRGLIKLSPEINEPKLVDLWGAAIFAPAAGAEAKRSRGPPPLPAPKLPPPGHAESYNPPVEYLMTEEEKREWREAEEKAVDFIPQKFDCLRKVPLYRNNILERFNRCLDLFLCPRMLKMKMNVDPDSILPPIPSTRNMKPFPTGLSICFDSPESSPATCLSFDSTGSFLSVGRNSGIIEIFDVPLSRRVVVSSSFHCEITAASFNPVLPILAFAAEVNLYVLVVRLPSFYSHIHNYDSSSSESSNTSSSTTTETQVNRVPQAWDILAGLRALQLSSNGDESPASSLASAAGGSDKWECLDSTDLEQMGDLGHMIVGGWKIEHKSSVTSISWHPRGLYFCTVCSNAASPSLQIGIHSLTKLKSIRPFRKNVGGKMQRAVFHPKKNQLFVAFHRGIRLYSLERPSDDGCHPTGSVVKKFKGVAYISDMGVHNSGDHIIVGGSNWRLTWFDLDLGDKAFRIYRFHKSAVKSVGYHSTYPLMYSAAADGSIHLFYAKVFSDFMESPMIVPLKKLQANKDLRRHSAATADLSSSAAASAAAALARVSAAQWHPQQPWLAVALKNGAVGLYA